ncbi:hypothetical protein FHL15_010263 [Xylaria flabelliformis]|uniref:non-specific serine/threonine protein kinase n=1 Tax=Xylaria flabelliformis TaxID=2512241 RepID=A0A553HLG5_9PEZI|nr:hypothetical protein FHL15_010263 [Xylaria flabelliformis]
MGAEVRLHGKEILKLGGRVTNDEEAALCIVRKYTTILVPEVYEGEYKTGVDGLPWDSAKERICNELRGFVKQLREKIPKPSSLQYLYQCGADGSAYKDVLLEDLKSPTEPLLSDDSVRSHINERYLHFNGGSYSENLMDYLPRSDKSVFTHADLAPRNVLVDDCGKITGPTTRRLNRLVTFISSRSYEERADMHQRTAREAQTFVSLGLWALVKNQHMTEPSRDDPFDAPAEKLGLLLYFALNVVNVAGFVYGQLLLLEIATQRNGMGQVLGSVKQYQKARLHDIAISRL